MLQITRNASMPGVWTRTSLYTANK